jgi:hypothetical protein
MRGGASRRKRFRNVKTPRAAIRQISKDLRNSAPVSGLLTWTA